MARIVKKEAPTGKRQNVWIFFLNAAFCAVLAIIGAATQLWILTAIGIVAAFVLMVIGAARASVALRQQEILQAGMMGERATADFIARFPDSYCGFQNLKVTYDGKTSELDMVVVGPTGVYVIEIKNHNGYIQGSYDNVQWIQHKTGRAGGSYSKTLYSPVKQVGTHVYRLANYLRSNGQRVHVDAMVFFTNPASTVQILGAPGKIPVFAGQPGAGQIAQRILAAPQTLSPRQVEEICRLLQKC